MWVKSEKKTFFIKNPTPREHLVRKEFTKNLHKHSPVKNLNYQIGLLGRETPSLYILFQNKPKIFYSHFHFNKTPTKVTLANPEITSSGMQGYQVQKSPTSRTFQNLLDPSALPVFMNMPQLATNDPKQIFNIQYSLQT